MINKPPIDKLTELAGNKYVLCCAISKRAKELNELQKEGEINMDAKTISLAAEEFVAGETQLKK
ncbi:MAG TPA: DNA-directed RNA polymerase subunit omega [Candidatus Limihabitans stercoravium]|nr:DNA-directed RNA polymerase subunit omega [Candidatus Limihabitans stercoravium]